MYQLCGMDISKVIRKIRDEKRLTQLELAERLQMERSNYARLEARGDKLTIEQLENIAGALGVGLLELLTGNLQAVADGNYVQKLEEQVRELEDKLKDKEFKIQRLYEQAFNVLDMINEECQDQMIRCAVKNKILDIYAKNDYIKFVEEEKGDEELYMLYWYWKKSKLRFKRFLPLNLIMKQEEITELFNILTGERGLIPVFYAFAMYCNSPIYSDRFDVSITKMFKDIASNNDLNYRITD